MLLTTDNTVVGDRPRIIKRLHLGYGLVTLFICEEATIGQCIDLATKELLWGYDILENGEIIDEVFFSDLRDAGDYVAFLSQRDVAGRITTNWCVDGKFWSVTTEAPCEED